MTDASTPLAVLSDDQLLRHVQQLAADERCATARLIAALTELDARRLYLAAGCASLFTYCTQVLRLSEHAAYGRIQAARTVRRFPIVLELFAEGAITLTTVTLLAPHLSPDNHRELLDLARGKSRREVERLVASVQPRPDAPATIRKLPEAQDAETRSMVSMAAAVPPSSEPAGQTIETDPAGLTAAAALAKHTRPVIAPTASDRYRIQITIGAPTHDKLRRARDLLRHTVPNGDPAVIFDRALTLLVGMLERQRFAAAARPRKAGLGGAIGRTRYLPAAIRRAVWKRDEGRCAFVGTQGRCTERGFLEFHHVQPYAADGVTSVDNLQLRCRAHNQYESERFFGLAVDRIGA